MRLARNLPVTTATGLPCYPAAEDLPPHALEEFQRLGVVRLRGAIGREHAERCCDQLWRALAGSGVLREDAATWQRMLASQAKPLAQHADFAFARQPRLAAAIERLLGPGWQRPSSGGMFFLTPPTPPTLTDEAWTMPRRSWHWDGRVDLTPGESIATQTILAPLATRHGGTLYVAGSHRLVRRFHADLPEASRHDHNKLQRKRFRERHAWFAALERDEPPASAEAIAEMMDRPFVAEGQELRIVDVHGEPGDVVIAAGFIIHSAPSRIGPGPRLVHVCGVNAAGAEADA